MRHIPAALALAIALALLSAWRGPVPPRAPVGSGDTTSPQSPTATSRASLLLQGVERDLRVRQVARESDMVVYAAGLDEGVKNDMKEIAEETGGAVVVAQSTRELKVLFERIVREMQARYVLRYYPNGVAKGGWHTIEVSVPRRGVDVVARRGYWRQ